MPRALFVVRPDSATRVGGDAVQAQKTAQGVRDLGWTVDVAATAQPDAAGYDIAHVFGVFDPQLAASQIAGVKRSGTPLALSPIWWDLTELFARSRAIERALGARFGSIESRLQRIHGSAPEQLLPARELRNLERRKALQRELMEQADVLLPNSITEAHAYVRDLDLQHARVQIVPNAIAPAAFEEDGRKRSGVLCVGRVESRKNQAMLLYALRDLDVDVTVVGECYDDSYRRLCKRFGKRATFVPPVTHEAAFALMRGALVHVLPAWVETPGIASLEAVASGCAIVVANRGSEFEYFRDDAWYCDPGSAGSILEAVCGALQHAAGSAQRPARERLRSLTWSSAAEATLAGYALVR